LVYVSSTLSSPSFVRTPSGLVPSECAYQVPSGSHIEHLDDDLGGGARVSYPDGTTIDIGPCRAKLPSLSEENTLSSNGLPPNGWQVYTYWIGPKTITSFLGGWNTPEKPSANLDQLLYLFTGLQNNCGGYGLCPNKSSSRIIRTNDGYISAQTNILQPVLQYGTSPAGGGNYWGIASWYVADIGTVYTNVEKVESEDYLFGNMSKEEGTSNKWVVAFNDVTDPTVTPTVLTVSKGTLTDYEPVAYVTLEVYGVSSCEAYPSDVVQFTNMSIMNDYSTPVTPTWLINTYSNACNESVQIVSPSQVNIQF